MIKNCIRAFVAIFYQMKIDTWRILSVTALIISLYFLIRLPFFTSLLIEYLEMNFSTDNQLINSGFPGIALHFGVSGVPKNRKIGFGYSAHRQFAVLHRAHDLWILQVG